MMHISIIVFFQQWLFELQSSYFSGKEGFDKALQKHRS